MPLLVPRSSLPPDTNREQEKDRRREHEQRLQEHPPETSSVVHIGFEIPLQLRGIDLLRGALHHLAPALGGGAGREFDGEFAPLVAGCRDDIGLRNQLRFPSWRGLIQLLNFAGRGGLALPFGAVEVSVCQNGNYREEQGEKDISG